MEAQEDSATGPQVHEDGCDNPYVDVLPDTHEVVSQSSIPFQTTQSQKKRRKFIPFKYHSKIFKKSKKNKDRNGNDMSIFQGADPHKHGARHAIEDNRVSTNSSSYESCRPHRNNVSCHTYVDIEECFEHRDMDIERCNSISTVSTLPVVTSRQRCGVDDHAGRQVVYREEQPSVNMTPKINYEMKVPDKSKGMKKYMVLFCIVLVSIVVSTVVAGYVGTKNVVKDIPDTVHNGLSDFSKKLKALNEQHFENLTSDLELNLDLFKNETMIQNELIQQRILSKTELNLDLFKNETMIQNELIQQRILNKTASKEDVMKNLNTMLDLTQSNTDDLKNETKMLHELITQRVMNETASKEDIKKTLFTILHVSICVNDCNGHIDGDYQSCYTCEGFVACRHHDLVNKTCQGSFPDKPVYWDNFKKRCLYESRTCDQTYIFN